MVNAKWSSSGSEKIASSPEQPDDGTDELNEKMDVHAYLNATVANLKEKNEKEEKLQNAINKAQEKAKSLQVACQWCARRKVWRWQQGLRQNLLSSHTLGDSSRCLNLVLTC